MKMKRKEFVFPILGVLLLCSAFPLATTVNAASEHVTFHVDAYVAEGHFSADMVSSGDSVQPGGTTTISFEAKQGGGSLYVDLGSYGGSSISFNTPLSSVSIPVSGITGIASVKVDLRGSLEGDLSVQGLGSLSTSHLSWNSWGKKTVMLDAGNAKEGDTISITLTLKYTGHIGAHGDTFLGDVTLISDQSLPGVSGSKSVVHTVKVQKEGILPGVPGFEMLMTLTAVAAVMLLHRRMKHRKE